MRFRAFHILFLAGFQINLPANSQIKLGEWRTHLPYQYCELAEATSDRVFCSSTGGLFTYNLTDKSVEKLSKVDGLSDNGVATMRWSNDNQVLVIAYQNSNLDLIRGGDILNMPDLMKKQIPGDKAIYDIFFQGSLAYLSTGFGIVVLNLDKNEIKETYYIGDNGDALRVNQVTVFDGYIYAATAMGIRRGLLSDPFLVDFNSWELLEDIPGYTGDFISIASFGDALFAAWNDPAGVQDRVYYKPGNNWEVFESFIAPHCYKMLDQGIYMTLVDSWNVGLVNQDYLVVKYVKAEKPQAASIDEEGNTWVASYGEGLVSYTDGNKWNVIPDGPQSTDAFDMASLGGKLYTVPGGINGASSLFRVANMESFSGSSWDYVKNEDSRDLISLAIDPADPSHVFAGSWGYGVHEYRGGEEIERYSYTNSSLQTIIPNQNYVRIGGLAFDPLGNLWVTNTNVSEPISVLKADKTWRSFKADDLISTYGILGDILVTQSGHKWVIIPSGNGLFAMDDNGTIDNEADDEYKRVSVVDKYGKVITNDVRCFTEDLNGNLWLGTNMGVLVIYSPYRLFSEGSVYAQQIIVPRNDGTDYGDPLLEEQVITAIEVDGANRKWIGTDGGGVYLVSDDGLETVYQFNELNSPLFSDNINDLCIDHESGEVFIATDKGLISYLGDAQAGSSDYSDVLVYPNPVREDYYGPIAIKGLVSETTVKIQDMGGNLVNELESFGGQAIWDGTNFSGQRVATGVYLIFLSNSDGMMSHVTKILFIH